MKISGEIFLRAQAELGEGPSWNAEQHLLYWVNILAGELHTLDLSTNQDRVFKVNQYIGFVVSQKNGDVIVGLKDGIASFNFATSTMNWLARPESDKPENRFNDAKCSPDGRLFAGTMAIDEHPGAGALYRLDADKIIHKILSPVSISNGIAWSPDYKTFYYIDTPTRNILEFNYDIETGEINHPKTVIQIPREDGWPDGMTSDQEGMLWIALWQGAKVCRYNPKHGRKILEINLPALNVTSCTFGGEKMETLYITSAWKGMNKEQREDYPHSGDLFIAETKIPGMPSFMFGN